MLFTGRPGLLKIVGLHKALWVIGWAQNGIFSNRLRVMEKKLPFLAKMIKTDKKCFFGP
jgi:hypothetical protein